MIVDLKKVLHEPLEFHLVFEGDWWQRHGETDKIIDFHGPLKVDLNISRRENRYPVQGRIEGILALKCDRCLETFDREIDSVFNVLLSSVNPAEEMEEVELLEEDMNIDFISGYEIELYDIVKEQIYLSLAIQTICRDNCRGLCPVCGVNLNRANCCCHKETGHPGFMKLKGLNLG